jgi:hypothetical protein
MTDLELSITTADRVIERARNGIVTFRAMNAAEEPHVIAALYHWRSVAYGVPDLLAEIESLKSELEAAKKRAADWINI